LSKDNSAEAGVRLERTGRHAEIWFETPSDGPPVVTIDIIDALNEMIEEISNLPDIRSVTLRSEGSDVFIAGGDLEEFASLETPEDGRAMAIKMRKALSALADLPCPVIAAVDGDVFGGGCETILAADIRIAVEGVRIAFTQGRFGLITGWGGATRLTRRVGPGRALFLLTTGRPVSAESAKGFGIVDKVVPASALEDYLAEIRANMELISPDSIKAAKSAVKAAITLPYQESMERELELFTQLWASPQHREGIQAFFDRRAPGWAAEGIEDS